MGASTGSRPAGRDAIFGHVVVGAAQAGVLRLPDTHLVLLGVAERHLAAQAGLGALHADEDLLAGTETDLERARVLVDADETLLESGDLVGQLCARARRGATLLVVGVRPHRRMAARTFGGHDVAALHDAPCSVLIARPGWGPSKPDKSVVGVDGSPESRTAEAAARSLAGRIGCEIVPVIALGEDVDLEVLRADRDDALLDPGRLVEAVVGATSKASLVVAGRGRERGRHWDGTIVERLVYSARCSVLVVQHESPGPVA